MKQVRILQRGEIGCVAKVKTPQGPIHCGIAFKVQPGRIMSVETITCRHEGKEITGRLINWDEIAERLVRDNLGEFVE